MAEDAGESEGKGAKKPRKIQLRPPNVLKLGRYCDAVAIDQWLTARGFRTKAKGE